MKTRQLLPITFIFAALAISTASYAQVKIGTNPTTVSPNANLEVEAANNKKVIIDKNIGTVQIQNLPSGAETDSIVTADANGVLRRVNRTTLLRLLNLSGSGQMTGGGQVLAQGTNIINFTGVTFDTEGGANLATDLFTIQRSGFYSINAKLTVQIPLGGPAGATGNFSFFLQKMNSGNVAVYNSAQIPRGFIGDGEATALIPCVAGDQFRIVAIPCNGCGVGQVGFTVIQSSLTLVKNY